MNAIDFRAILPLAILVAWACILLLVNLFISPQRSWLSPLLAALGLAVSLILTLTLGLSLAADSAPLTFNSMFVVDGFSIFLDVIFLVSGLVGVALSYNYLKRMNLERGEYYVLMLFSITGMMLMGHAADLIVVFLALELLSFPLYVLSAFARPKPESEEAGLKYFLLGAFSSSFVVYGVALVFGATGVTSIQGVLAAYSAGTANLALMSAGAGLILIGLGFKVAAVPFHMWTPDVYQGAPTAIVAFMAVASKAGGFAALLRVFITAFPALSADLVPVFWGIAALTMILGNFLAIAQTNIKRLLAYSSIAHAGYLLMALAPYGQEEVAAQSVASALFYLVAYGLTSFAAWAVVIALEKSEGRGLRLDDYAGLWRKYPGLALAMGIAMLSFTGIPPTLGFVGKFYMFRTALQGGYVGLALIGVFTSLISAYYYLRVVIIMFMRDGEPEAINEPWLNLTAGVSAAATVLLAIFSAPLFRWAAEAVLRLF